MQVCWKKHFFPSTHCTLTSVTDTAHLFFVHCAVHEVEGRPWRILAQWDAAIILFVLQATIICSDYSFSLLQAVHLAQVSFQLEAFGSRFVLDLSLNK